MVLVSHPCLSPSGLPLDEDLPGVKVGPTLHRPAVIGGDSEGESPLSHPSPRSLWFMSPWTSWVPCRIGFLDNQKLSDQVVGILGETVKPSQNITR